MFRRLSSPDTFLDRLEREANDDFGLLAELGPTDFGVEHLQELRHYMRLRLEQFDRWRKLNVMIGATAAGWFLLALAAYYIGQNILSLLALSAMSLALLGFLAGVFLLHRRFNSRGELEHTLHTIEDELRRRAGMKPPKPRGA